MFVSVAIDLALDRLFTYSVPVELTEKLRVGQLLRVPFGHREASGFALRLSSDPPPGATYAIRPVLGIADEAPFFSPPVLELVKWIAAYTCSPIETCLRAAVPAAVLKPSARPRELLFVEPALSPGSAPLTPRQRELYDNLARVGGGWMQQICREFGTTPASIRALAQKGCATVQARAKRRDPLAGRTVMRTEPLALNELQAAALAAILSGESGSGRPPKPVLLHGVTGSGKTEIYLQAIARELAAGRGAIVLVPEIALTPQTVRRFAGRFGGLVAVLHSALSAGERFDEWHRIRTGEARVVVGPRSAVFAPVRDLGLIVVDEEHDSSYKQDETPRYHARDVAVMRAHFEGCRVVLGSATPSLESWRNAQCGKYALASVPARVAGRALPEVHLVDLAEETAAYGHVPIFSKFLLDAVAERLRRGEQTILLLNRRGYARVCTCRQCGRALECPNCSMAYTYHQADDCLRCHVCGGWMRVPLRCPACGAREFSYEGVGTQRAESALRKCLPQARIARMDADSTSRKFSHDDILSQFRAREVDVLLGTQMIAKGLDFPNVTLVGVLNADAALNMPDFRASERTFQLLAQVSGRAGRAEKPGEVFIQTSQPDAPAVAAAAKGDYEDFARQELAAREEDFLPPYSRLAVAHFRSKDESLARGWCALYAASLAHYPSLTAGEPMPAPLERAEGWYRHQLLLRAAQAKTITAAWRWITEARPVPEGVRAHLDADAVSLA